MGTTHLSGLEVAGVPTQGVSGAPLFTGNWFFVDAINGPGVWRSLPATAQQPMRDNARTLLGQVNEQRPAFTRADAESIGVPVLFIGGEKTPGALPVVLRALAARVPGAKVEIIPNATHAMFEDDPDAVAALLGLD